MQSNLLQTGMDGLGQIKLAVFMGELSPLGKLLKAWRVGERIDQCERAGDASSVDRHIDRSGSVPVSVQKVRLGIDEQTQYFG